MKKISKYKQCWNYFLENKYYFLFILTLFILIGIFGFLFPIFFVETIENIIKELIEKTKDMNIFQIFIFIFSNNTYTAFLGLFSGILLGILPIFLCLFNGYVIGFVSSKTSEVAGFSVLWRLLPHGIFEIPALVLSLGLGLRMSSFIFYKDKKKRFLSDFKNSLLFFIYVILPLLFIAAIIETSLMFILK